MIDALNDREVARANVLKVDLETLTALIVDLQVADGPGNETHVIRVPVQNTDGTVSAVDLLVVPMHALIPVDKLARMSRVLSASGAAMHPLTGMLPVAEARLVVPKVAVRDPNAVEPANVVEFRRG